MAKFSPSQSTPTTRDRGAAVLTHTPWHVCALTRCSHLPSWLCVSDKQVGRTSLLYVHCVHHNREQTRGAKGRAEGA